MISLPFAGLFSQDLEKTDEDKPVVVEYYYKAKWGHLQEFIDLYKKNHYPLLEKQLEMGRILDLSAVYPFYHQTEEGRWDFRFTITFKNSTVAHDDFDMSEIIKEMYPDQEKFKAEERRRFEILKAHRDILLRLEDIGKW